MAMAVDSYEAYIAGKLAYQPPTGIMTVPQLHASLFQFQRDITAWALRRGRCAIFADTGLGKTAMSLAWAEHVPGDVLILAPLAVAPQTKNEGARMGIGVTICRDGADVMPGINVTNYERLHRFDPLRFAGVVLDESSCIKHQYSKTLKVLLDAFARTPYRLAATATPAPNDYTELGTHAEFLGVCSREEMLAEFFCHDGGETQVWRLKRHAKHAFWRFVASWAALLRKPSDLGYDDAGYELPPLRVEQHTQSADEETTKAAGLLFPVPATSLMERRAARKASIGARVRDCANLVMASDERWIVWCDLNAEQDALAAIFGDECWSVYGALDMDEKERRLAAFVTGERRILLGKPSIFGFGLNLQMVANMAFVGVTDSYEAFYQAVRRAWRFGQTRPVTVHVFASELEGAVIKNLQRKERDAMELAKQLAAETRDAVICEVRGTVRQTTEYTATTALVVPSWLKTGGD